MFTDREASSIRVLCSRMEFKCRWAARSRCNRSCIRRLRSYVHGRKRVINTGQTSKGCGPMSTGREGTMSPCKEQSSTQVLYSQVRRSFRCELAIFRIGNSMKPLSVLSKRISSATTELFIKDLNKDTHLSFQCQSTSVLKQASSAETK